MGTSSWGTSCVSFSMGGMGGIGSTLSSTEGLTGSAQRRRRYKTYKRIQKNPAPRLPPIATPYSLPGALDGSETHTFAGHVSQSFGYDC